MKNSFTLETEQVRFGNRQLETALSCVHIYGHFYVYRACGPSSPSVYDRPIQIDTVKTMSYQMICNIRPHLPAVSGP